MVDTVCTSSAEIWRILQEQLPHFDLFEILGDPEYPSEYPQSCVAEDIKNDVLTYSTNSVETNITDDIQTYIHEECLITEQHGEILFDIGGFMYPVDPNIDITINGRSDVSTLHTSQSLYMPARARFAREYDVMPYYEQVMMPGQIINDEMTSPARYSAPYLPCPSNSTIHLRPSEPCTSASDCTYFWPNPLSSNCTGSGRKRTRGCRLWEFLRNLLRDPRFNPSYICWENEAERKFRIVKSKELAKLWGSKKGNAKMTYEKLSRAMRYYYKGNVPVIGKRLVYSFGPRADLTP